MSDYLGPNQTRVLDSTNHNFESITYQLQKPPLSNEFNLTGKIDAERSQKIVQTLMPSGWTLVGQAHDNLTPTQCQVGDVLCSSDCSSNSFWFIGQNYGLNTEKNVALVNGWRVVVQGSASPTGNGYPAYTNSTEDNLIRLPAPPETGSRIDFVFLEVWRKLIDTEGTVYQYGNVDHADPFSNDLIDPARGFETSRRIQIQYRIRVAEIDNLDIHPDGFCDSVNVQGPLPTPISTCSHANFSPVPGDPGLWIAGAGDEVAQETLQTVDGHTYAIPMFAIRRRNTQAFDPRISNINGTTQTLADYKNGIPSDRPDNLYNDWIVAEDFIDLRHRIGLEGDMKSLCTRAFRALQNNSLKSHSGSSTLGGEQNGPVQVKIDYIAPLQSNEIDTWATFMGQGNGIRKWFTNAAGTELNLHVKRTIAEKTIGAGNPWADSDEVTIDLNTLNFPADAVISDIEYSNIHTVEGLLFNNLEYWNVVSGMDTRVVVLALVGTPVPDNNSDIIFPFKIRYESGEKGLSEVPTKFLEVRKIETFPSTMYPIATKDQDIRVRYGDAATPVNTSDLGRQYNMLRARGGTNKELYNFGHQMVYHVLGNGSSSIAIDRNISGYDIIGIASVVTSGSTIQGISSVVRSITGYTINLSSSVPVNNDVALTLYTGSKYFEGNKQSRGILDCYQMVELDTLETPDGVRTEFILDNPKGYRVMSVANYADQDGACYAYENNGGTETMVSLSTNNRSFPGIENAVTVTFAVPPVYPVTIPCLLESAIDSDESYAFYYQYVSYQGILKTIAPYQATGAIEAEGPAITTSAGSGDFRNYSTSAVGLFTGTTVVNGVDSDWLSSVRSGYLVSSTSEPDGKQYMVQSVVSDTQLILTTISDRSSVDVEDLYIEAPDFPNNNYPNIIDRFPTWDSLNDHSGNNTPILNYFGYSNATLENSVCARLQDIVDAPVNTIVIGANDTTPEGRGRAAINIPSAPYGAGNLGLTFQGVDPHNEEDPPPETYKKTFQSYLLNKDNSGRLYLMVVGSETRNTSGSCSLNAYSNMDAVDIFEIPGRPIIANRIQ